MEAAWKYELWYESCVYAVAVNDLIDETLQFAQYKAMVHRLL